MTLLTCSSITWRTRRVQPLIVSSAEVRRTKSPRQPRPRRRTGGSVNAIPCGQCELRAQRASTRKSSPGEGPHLARRLRGRLLEHALDEHARPSVPEVLNRPDRRRHERLEVGWRGSVVELEEGELILVRRAASLHPAADADGLANLRRAQAARSGRQWSHNMRFAAFPPPRLAAAMPDGRPMQAHQRQALALRPVDVHDSSAAEGLGVRHHRRRRASLLRQSRLLFR